MSRYPLEILKEKLSKISDCAIITNDINRRYFTGMKSSAGTVVVFPDEAYLIIDFRYIEKAQKTVKNCNVIMQEKLFEQINHLVSKHGAKTVLIESESMTVSELSKFKAKLNAQIDSSDNLSEIIKSIRVIKSDEEIEKISQAQKIAELGFEHILEIARPGISERDIRLELDYFMLKNGAEALSFDTIAISGKNTSLPHGTPSDKKIENGEFVLLDYGAVVDGWHSDMTRTFCVGTPDKEMKYVYDTVLEAQKSALEKVKSGITGAELDLAARDVINNAGFKDNFGHALGHGVGMEIHEAPTASPSCNNVLETNMVITVEPGIYIPDKFGVRIEDFVVVKDNGCINLTSAPKHLICV